MPYVEGLTGYEPIIAKRPGHRKTGCGGKLRFKAGQTKLYLFNADGKACRR